jgi:hypothetical protein
MARQKLAVAVFKVSVNRVQYDALMQLMEEDMQDNVAQYFGLLIAEVTRNREALKAKKPSGRPSKKDDDGDKVYYNAPYDKNAPPYTMSELEAYYTFRKETVPEGLKPLTKEQLSKWDM